MGLTRHHLTLQQQPIMASGVTVSAEAVAKWEELKLSKKKNDTMKYMILKIDMDAGEICVELEHGKKTDTGKECWDDMVNTLPPTEGRYICYDFDYTTTDGRPQNKLTFIVWNPEDSKIKQKMLYASSKDGIKTKFHGIAKEIQGTDMDEMDHEYIVTQMKK